MNQVSPEVGSDPAPAHPALRIDGARLWQRLMTLAAIGATPRGGVCRIALTDLDRQGRELFATWAAELGCTLRRDAIGLLQESQQQVLRLDLAMVVAFGQRLGFDNGFLGFLCKFIKSHGVFPFAIIARLPRAGRSETGLGRINKARWIA